MSEPSAEHSTTRIGDDAAPQRGSLAGLLGKGDTVDRYVVLERVGRGGTGEVYRAYDPDLDRRVAIKVLWRRADGVAGTRARLVHEARALARLQHPGVVQVFDVGVDGERVFLAMEYLQGPTMAAWLRTTRSWRAVAAVLLAAGRGLAAAHDSGLLHRDFKPSNVIVTESGRVCVIDLGLALPRPEGAGDGGGAAPDRGPSGTPAYLAPELYDGAPATVASDVFSFCVCAWEALFGARPWIDADEGALTEHKRRGPPSPGRTAVGRRLVEVLRRGLAPEAAARPTMAPVLAALERATASPTRRRIGLGALAIGAVTAAVWASRPGPCADASAAADAIWNDATRKATLDALSGVATPFGAESARHVEHAIDRHVARWSAARVDACAATFERHEQSSELFDRRVACFDRQLRALGSLLAVYADADAEIGARAVDMIGALDPASQCDGDVVQRGADHPLAPELLAELDRARVLESAAQYADAMALVDGLLASHPDDDDAWLEASYLRGRLLDRLGDPQAALTLLQDVHFRAEAAGADVLAAKAAVYVVFELAAVLARPVDALAWAPHARAAIERAGDDQGLRATLLENEGTAYLAAQDGDTALLRYQAALAIREALADRDALGLLSTLGSIGVLLEELHRYDEALAIGQRALTLAQRTVGEGHPHTARSHDNLGTTLVRAGRLDEAMVELQRALEIRRAALGPEHPLVALSAGHLGLAYLDGGAPERAVASYRLAVEIGGKGRVGGTAMLRYREGLAHALEAAGSPAEAVDHARAAHDGLRAVLGPDHPEVEGLRALLLRIDPPPAEPPP